MYSVYLSGLGFLMDKEILQVQKRAPNSKMGILGNHATLLIYKVSWKCYLTALKLQT